MYFEKVWEQDNPHVFSGITNLLQDSATNQKNDSFVFQLTKFDEILVMKDGRLVKQGTFDELMAHDDYFKALYTLEQ